jgi:hypothetical protein
MEFQILRGEGDAKKTILEGRAAVNLVRAAAHLRL